MAGIGFILRKLANRDNFLDLFRAYFHSAVVATLPWILLVLCLVFINLFTIESVGVYEMNNFYSVIVWNLLLSFIGSSGLYTLSSRYVSDCLYERDISPIPGIFISSLFLITLPMTLVSILVYGLYADMSFLMTILSVINFGLFSQIWIIMLYLSLIRSYTAISISWIFGVGICIFSSISLGKLYDSTGLLGGMNIGLTVLAYSLSSQILASYPEPFTIAKKLWSYYKRFKQLFWSGFFLCAGMWVDKLIMWWAPGSLIHSNNLRTNPAYDTGVFFSYFSIIPVMALFIFKLETNFYTSYIQYIQYIEHNAPLSFIQNEKKNIIKKILENGRSFLILQGSLTLVTILLAPTIFEWMKIDFISLNIFRLGALGAFFSAMNLFIVIYFSYFDSQNNMFICTLTLFLSNLILTLGTVHLGFSYYGYGYALSMTLTFFVSAILFTRFLHNLTYHIFITNTIKKQNYKKKK
jgi:polysaccharide biosynthesis protein PelG